MHHFMEHMPHEQNNTEWRQTEHALKFFPGKLERHTASVATLVSSIITAALPNDAFYW